MKWFSLMIAFLFNEHCQGKDYYRAAVVEHHSLSGDSPSDTILKNLVIYRTHIAEANAQNVDVIIFPEYGLTTLVENPKGYAINFSENSTVLQNFSYLACKYNVYIVVNLLEECEENGKISYYNTDLVYDRKGQIIAKYRKISLYVEPQLTRGTEIVTFTTDFGVTFGIFTCMDILYGNPSREILKNNNVTDIIFPTAWYSTMPFYTALTVQHGYSLANGVNLLAANYGQYEKGHGGSGIYLANGKIYINSSKMIVGDVKIIAKKQEPTNCSVPKISQGTLTDRNMSDYFTYTDFKAEDYVFKNVDVSQPQQLSEICYGKFCCNFTITVRQPAEEVIYKLMAYDGEVIYDQSPAHIRVCNLVACKNESNNSCGARVNSVTKFTQITVDGILEKNDATFYTPVTLNSSLRPILNTSYCSERGNGTQHIRLAILQPQENVLVFGIFGRVE